MTEETKCGKCGLPIHPSESGVRYFGLFTAHSEGRCTQLLHLEITRLRAALDARDAAIKVAETVVAERHVYQGENYWPHENEVFHHKLDNLDFALAALAAAKEGK